MRLTHRKYFIIVYYVHSVFKVDAVHTNKPLLKRRVNPLKTKRRPLYLKTQSVPRC